jgi:hypothetical protein
MVPGLAGIIAFFSHFRKADTEDAFGPGSLRTVTDEAEQSAPVNT